MNPPAGLLQARHATGADSVGRVAVPVFSLRIEIRIAGHRLIFAVDEELIGVELRRQLSSLHDVVAIGLPLQMQLHRRR